MAKLVVVRLHPRSRLICNINTDTAGNADTTFSLIASLANHISWLIPPLSLATDCGTTVAKETRHHRWSRNQHGTGHRPSCSLASFGSLATVHPVCSHPPPHVDNCHKDQGASVNIVKRFLDVTMEGAKRFKCLLRLDFFIL